MNEAVCSTCPRSCRIPEGGSGACRARGNVAGRIVCTNYGRITSLALDPVEKKPFACWQSGMSILSVGSYGCNLACPCCQNHQIAQAGADDVGWRAVEPAALADEALALSCECSGCIGVAYTYNEPLVGFEFVLDTAALVRSHGLLNAVVTNGMCNPDIFDRVLDAVDAVNIDLKGFSNRFYEACGLASFETVKRNIEAAANHERCHLEITSLIVPRLTDDSEMERAWQWIASVDKAIPTHISQYHPAYRMTEPPVPAHHVQESARRAQVYLENVYVGNLPGRGF